MFENSNKGIVKELAQAVFRVHKLRNFLACLGIFLTTVLLAVVCGVGFSIVQAFQLQYSMNPGPGTNGVGIMGSTQVYEKVLEQPEVEWAELVRLCMQGTPKNQEFAGLEVKVLGVSSGYYNRNYITLQEGSFPSSPEEILVSDTMQERLGDTVSAGNTYTLNMVKWEDGVSTQVPVKVKISGIYKNPLKIISDYEEIYTVQNFPEVYDMGTEGKYDKIFIKIKGLEKDADTQVLAEKLGEINEACGGAGAVYITAQDASREILAAVFFLALIILCGYFLIYNIFYISVLNDIRFMGSMKTIGMSGKQIRRLLNWQIIRLALGGILPGLLAGALLNIFVSGILRSDAMDLSCADYIESRISPMALAAAAVFAGITVFISSRKALSLAARISPVEAARYRGGSRMKTVIAIVSFALSGVLFVVLYGFTLGYDVESYVNRWNTADISVYQYYADIPGEGPYEVFSKELAENLINLDFVEDAHVFYKARNLERENEGSVFSESLSPVKMEGKWKESIERRYESLGGVDSAYVLNERGDYMTSIAGLEGSCLKTEQNGAEVIEGELDQEKFDSGEYFIYSPLPLTGEADFGGLHAGDKVKMSFYNNHTGAYVEKELTVLALVNQNYNNRGLMNSNEILISDKLFREIYGESSENMISEVVLDTKEGDRAGQEEQAEQVISQSLNSQVRIYSRYKSQIEGEGFKMQMSCIGIFAGIVFGIIGMANVANTIITGVLSRKLEYAALQSIGMTQKQMRRRIFSEGIKIEWAGFLAAALLGAPITAAIAAPPMFTGFSLSAYLWGIGIFFLAGLCLAGAVAFGLTRALNKKSVVERLREAE